MGDRGHPLRREPPERVSALALAGGLGPPDTSPDDAPVQMRAWLEGIERCRSRPAEWTFDSVDEGARRLAFAHPGIPAEVLRGRAEHLLGKRDDGRWGWNADPLHRTRSPIPFYASAYAAFARRVRAPVLVMGGGPSGFHPEDEEARIAAFADVRRVELDTAGHMMHWTQPEAVGAHLVRFFEETVAATPAM